MDAVTSIGVAIIAGLMFYLYPMAQQLLGLVNSINQKLFDAENRWRADISTIESSLSDINRTLKDIKTILEQQRK